MRLQREGVSGNLFPKRTKHVIIQAGKLAHDFVSGVLDLVYPPYCLTCGKAGEDYFCPECEEKIDVIPPPVCQKCGTPSESFHCPDCRDREFAFAFEFARGAATFDGVLREAIHALKYQSRVVMAEPLGAIMSRCFPTTHIAGKVDLAIPIPIHKSRLVERGFNQATELARVLCKRTGLPLDASVLYKRRNTRPQAYLPFEERLINLEGAFAVRHPERIQGQRILLIDDVMTTGCTLHEAARTLREAGSGQVIAYTLARAI